MGMDYQKIHACPIDCILYMHEFQEMSKYPICGTSRYKVKDEEESSSDENYNKGPLVSYKFVFLFVQFIILYFILSLSYFINQILDKYF